MGVCLYAGMLALAPLLAGPGVLVRAVAVGTLVMGGVVLVIVMAILLPIFELNTIIR